MAKKLYGGETEKAVNNFPISGETVPLAVIHWLGRIKGAAARGGEYAAYGDRKRFDFFVQNLLGVKPPDWNASPARATSQQ